MKVSLDAQIYDVFGTAIKFEVDKPLTIRRAMANALLAETEQGAAGADKYSRYSLALKIANAGDSVNFTTEEAARIKSAVGKAFGATVVGPVYNAIDPPDTAE